MGKELFDNAIRSAGDLAGVFECDGDTGYFYLYDKFAPERHRVLGSIHIYSGDQDLSAVDIAIRWDAGEQRVGLFLKSVLWAVFDTRPQSQYGGNYRPGTTPSLPSEVRQAFRCVG